VKVESDGEVDSVKSHQGPKSVPSAEPFKTFENVSSRNFLDEPENLLEAELEAQGVCRPLPLKEAVMETSEIYPKLNFNVSHHCCYFLLWFS
jgi:hypothetical protein